MTLIAGCYTLYLYVLLFVIKQQKNHQQNLFQILISKSSIQNYIYFFKTMKIFFIAIALLSLVMSTLGYQWYLENHPTFITESNINPLLNDQSSIKIVKFFTPWCRYCRYMKKIIDNYHQKLKYHGRKDIKFYQVNCEQQKTICQGYGVTSYPFIYIFGKNGKILSNIQGYQPQQDTHQILTNIIRQIDQIDNIQYKNFDQSVVQPEQMNQVEQKEIIKPQQNKQKITPNTVKSNLQKQETKNKINQNQQQKKQLNKNTGAKANTPKVQGFHFEKKQQQTQVVSSQNTNKAHLNIHNETLSGRISKQIGRIIIYLIIGVIAGFYFKDIFAKKNQSNFSNPQEANFSVYNKQKLPQNEPLINS